MMSVITSKIKLQQMYRQNATKGLTSGLQSHRLTPGLHSRWSLAFQCADFGGGANRQKQVENTYCTLLRRTLPQIAAGPYLPATCHHGDRHAAGPLHPFAFTPPTAVGATVVISACTAVPFACTMFNKHVSLLYTVHRQTHTKSC